MRLPSVSGTGKLLGRQKLIGLGLGIGLIAIGAYGLLQWYTTTHRHETPAIVAPASPSADTNVDETPVKEESWRVPADMPRKIEISAISLEGMIQQVGVDREGAVGVPSNVNLAGWYTNSVKPGEKGVSLIDGHVSGRYSDGIFKNIHKLAENDEIKMEYGDGSRRSFIVVDVRSYSPQEAASQQYEQHPNIEKQLTLITCGGAFDNASDSYSQRVIVRATLKS